MKLRSVQALLLAACLWLSGCAASSGLFGAADSAPTLRDPGMAVETARDLIVPVTASKADVAALLGPAIAVPFDSGFEVWVYRGKSREGVGALAELIILFDPSGHVRKIRIRPALETARR